MKLQLYFKSVTLAVLMLPKNRENDCIHNVTHESRVNFLHHFCLLCSMDIVLQTQVTASAALDDAFIFIANAITILSPFHKRKNQIRI